MYLSREQFDEIRKKYSLLLVVDSDTTDALKFAYDVMIAEIDALNEKAPYAATTINRMEQSAYILFETIQEVESERFSEGEG